jgi:hypothetical protein
MSIQEKLHSVSQDAVGKASITIGGGGWLLDYFNEWEPWLNMFLKLGNGLLLVGGLYLMSHKVFDKWRSRG